MKKLFLLFTLAFVAMSCEMIDEKLDDFIGRDDSSVTTIANNQIWYTSTDGEIVEPYSGENNNYADALTTFGVNIVSNTYVDGKGVIEFDGDVTIIGDYAFWFCTSLTSVTIGDSVTTIGEGAFYNCYSLTSVTIPNSVTEIGYYAFAECSSFISVTIPDSVTEIGNYAFAWCSSLTSVTIPDSVTTIGKWAFDDCSSLESITIPDSVTTIGYAAFSSCSSLTSVYCKPTTPPAGGYDMFYYNASGRKIYVPMESVEAYKSAYRWSEYADDIEGYNF